MTSPSSDTPGAPLVLPAQLDTAAAGPLHGALLAAVGAPLALDARQVTFVGTLCAQLLVAAGRHWRAGRHGLTLLHPSEGLSLGLARLGLGLEDISGETAP